jgi:hypothetical protein
VPWFFRRRKTILQARVARLRACIVGLVRPGRCITISRS